MTVSPVSSINPLLASNRVSMQAPSATTEPAAGDTVSISEAARSRVARDVTADNPQAQWQAALDNQRSGVPQLVRVDSAIAGGLADMEQRLHGLLLEHGFDRNTHFSLQYDASTRSYRVDGAVEVKHTLEADLNTTAPSPAAAAIREGYGLLENMVTGLSAMRDAYAQDHAGQERQGHAYGFHMEWHAGTLSTQLEMPG